MKPRARCYINHGITANTTASPTYTFQRLLSRRPLKHVTSFYRDRCSELLWLYLRFAWSSVSVHPYPNSIAVAVRCATSSDSDGSCNPIINIGKRNLDRLCGLVLRVSGYRYRGLGFDSRRYQIFWVVVVGLERGPLSLVRSIEELLE